MNCGVQRKWPHDMSRRMKYIICTGHESAGRNASSKTVGKTRRIPCRRLVSPTVYCMFVSPRCRLFPCAAALILPRVKLAVSRRYAQVENQMVSVERVLGYCRVPQEASLESEPACKPADGWPAKGDIEVGHPSVFDLLRKSILPCVFVVDSLIIGVLFRFCPSVLFSPPQHVILLLSTSQWRRIRTTV